MKNVYRFIHITYVDGSWCISSAASIDMLGRMNWHASPGEFVFSMIGGQSVNHRQLSEINRFLKHLNPKYPQASDLP